MAKKSSRRPPAEETELRAAPPFAETDPRDRIARRARELWENDGRPDGRDEHYWYTAERQLGRLIDDRGSRSEEL